jgi:acetylserotonin N-methyltransferase
MAELCRVGGGEERPHRVSDLRTPTADPSQLFALGVLGIPLVQYINWADRLGLFTFMAGRATVSVGDVVDHTPLNLRGADAFLGVLCGLNLVVKDGGDGYALAEVARQYLDSGTRFYVGLSLHGMLRAAIPKRMVKGARPRRFSKSIGTLRDTVQFWRNPYQWGRPERLRIQHSRNFPAAVVAARSGAFDGITHLADIGGGSGVFSIPLVLDRSDIHVTLVDLPRSLPSIKEFLQAYGVEDRVALAGFDVHATPWPLGVCDGILFANFMHSCADDECRFLLQRSHEHLSPGGRLLLHEMLWNDRRDGPLVTSLWNFWMISVSAGRQRTAAEMTTLVTDAGFRDVVVTPTAGDFSLVAACKPATARTRPHEPARPAAVLA